MADWDKIRAEYLKGGTSYRKLAAKHGVPFKTLSQRAKREQWAQNMLQVKDKVATQVNTAIEAGIVEGSAKCDLTIYDVAAELLELTRESMRSAAVSEGGIKAGELSLYASAIRSIRIAMQRPSDLDLEEQRARIEKLRRDASAADDDSETGVILLPRRMDDA